ncbi:MAG: hypothetical protein IPK33_08360 [Gemmatimonadetes bacterium]|nr:hypothetical protein [Gemmatimonadota bacterium]
MYQLLFVIHGMGSGDRGSDAGNWSDGVLKSLLGAAEPFGLSKRLKVTNPKSGDVLVVPLTYHQFFDETRTKWATEQPHRDAWAALLKGLLGGASTVAGGKDAEAKVDEWLVSATGFFWSHILDVLLYRFSGDHMAPIRNHVASEIAKAWSQADFINDARTPVHFVAHSLGTAVLHDALCTLAAEPGFGPATQRINTILTLANVSSVLQTNFDPYREANRPVSAPPSPGGMTERFIYCRHDVDPIPAVKPFDAEKHGWPVDGWDEEVLVDIKEWNVHGYTHYLDNPDAHLQLFERVWPTIDWASRWEAARQKYRESAGAKCPQAIAALRESLRNVIRAIKADDVFEAIETGIMAYSAMEKARDSCRQEAQ